MIQKLRAALDADDRAVSPVIGVILMVAITVILAAVIASLTLGLGDSAQTAPTAKFDFNQETTGYDTAAATGDELQLTTVEISHRSGASIDQGRITITVDGEAAYGADSSNGNVQSLWATDGNDITAGSSVSVLLKDTEPDTGADITTLAIDDDGSNAYSTTSGAGSEGGVLISEGSTIKVIWTSEDGGSSSTLAEYTVE